MIKNFPVDEMHIIHLGVVKKLIGFWNNSLTKEQKNSIENRIKRIETSRPIEIHRKIRSLSAIAQFKANECRNFLQFYWTSNFKKYFK